MLNDATAVHAQIRELADMVVAWNAHAILSISEGEKSGPSVTSASLTEESVCQHCICVFGLDDQQEEIMLESVITSEGSEVQFAPFQSHDDGRAYFFTPIRAAFRKLRSRQQ